MVDYEMTTILHSLMNHNRYLYIYKYTWELRFLALIVNVSQNIQFYIIMMIHITGIMYPHVDAYHSSIHPYRLWRNFRGLGTTRAIYETKYEYMTTNVDRTRWNCSLIRWLYGIHTGTYNN